MGFSDEEVKHLWALFGELSKLYQLIVHGNKAAARSYHLLLSADEGRVAMLIYDEPLSLMNYNTGQVMRFWKSYWAAATQLQKDIVSAREILSNNVEKSNEGTAKL